MAQRKFEKFERVLKEQSSLRPIWSLFCFKCDPFLSIIITLSFLLCRLIKQSNKTQEERKEEETQMPEKYARSSGSSSTKHLSKSSSFSIILGEILSKQSFLPPCQASHNSYMHTLSSDRTRNEKKERKPKKQTTKKREITMILLWKVGRFLSFSTGSFFVPFSTWQTQWFSQWPSYEVLKDFDKNILVMTYPSKFN